jgi:hypothetical protein
MGEKKKKPYKEMIIRDTTKNLLKQQNELKKKQNEFFLFL